ncbi:MAG TPA: hypothetical protein VKY44_05925 [Flavobacterium sp.]|nr:hypothetical protein [Flavobacterium sp.]
MINSEIKDVLLNALCDSDHFERVEILELNQILEITGLSFDELNAVLKQFERMGFVSEIMMRRNSPSLYIAVHLDALDYKNRGGFVGQDELLKMSLEKLSLEIEDLRKSYPDKAATFTTIAANIATCLTFLATKL